MNQCGNRQPSSSPKHCALPPRVVQALQQGALCKLKDPAAPMQKGLSAWRQGQLGPVQRGQTRSQQARAPSGRPGAKHSPGLRPETRKGCLAPASIQGPAGPKGPQSSRLQGQEHLAALRLSSRSCTPLLMGRAPRGSAVVQAAPSAAFNPLLW